MTEGVWLYVGGAGQLDLLMLESKFYSFQAISQLFLVVGYRIKLIPFPLAWPMA